MKTFPCIAALLLGALATSARAQYIVGTPVTTYYAPAAPVVAAPVATPVVAAPLVYPRRAYYAPAPVVRSYYAPAPAISTYYAPTVAAPVAAPVVTTPVVTSAYLPTTTVVARPVVLGRSVYGTRQVYVPGQPILNTFRAITP